MTMRSGNFRILSSLELSCIDMNQFPGKFPFSPIILLLKMVRQNGGVSLQRIPVLVIYILRFVLLEPFRLTEIILYHKKIKAHELTQSPIFILGHWRSGTSFLQNVISQDPSVTSSNIYRSLFADMFFLTESWLKPIFNSIVKVLRIPYSLQRIPMDLNLAAEADMALCALCSERSYTWGQLFPRVFEKWVDDIILFKDPELAKQWIEHYDYFIRKLSYQSNGKRVVIKSPGDTGRVSHLIKKYPKASFVYIHREPFSLFYSNLYFWKVILKQVSLQTLSKTDVEALVINSYKKIVSKYLNDRKLIPAGQLIEVQLHDLAKQRHQELNRIFNALGLRMLDEKQIKAVVTAYSIERKSTYEEDRSLQERLRQEWNFAWDAWPTTNLINEPD